MKINMIGYRAILKNNTNLLRKYFDQIANQAKQIKNDRNQEDQQLKQFQ
jgi:hypothetical protein